MVLIDSSSILNVKAFSWVPTTLSTKDLKNLPTLVHDSTWCMERKNMACRYPYYFNRLSKNTFHCIRREGRFSLGLVPLPLPPPIVNSLIRWLLKLPSHLKWFNYLQKRCPFPVKTRLIAPVETCCCPSIGIEISWWRCLLWRSASSIFTARGHYIASTKAPLFKSLFFFYGQFCYTAHQSWIMTQMGSKEKLNLIVPFGDFLKIYSLRFTNIHALVLILSDVV